MAAKKQIRGKCEFCGKETAKGWMIRHLKSCEAREEAIKKADEKKERGQNIYHLLVENAYMKDFWLHLEMKGSAAMEYLDAYLKAIWLECCGHLSEFTFEAWNEQKTVSMETPADEVFSPGTELIHLYDFGSTTETLIKVIEEREGKPLTGHPIFLMARNQIPNAPCQVCGEQSKWLCIECNDEGRMGGLCDRHVKKHPHNNYGGPLPVVNSPRVGVCGYGGPAEPPY